MYIEIYGQISEVSYYLVDGTAGLELRAYHPGITSELSKVEVVTVGDIYELVRPFVETLQNKSDISERYTIREFTLPVVQTSLTRNTVVTWGEYESGDENYIDGVRQPLRFHHT